MKRKEPTLTDNKSLLQQQPATMEYENDVQNPRKVSRHDPIQRDQKYDRQLRLWGNDGQQALEEANVCLINATATGTETLKCLVLPGVGKYFVVDDAIVTATDTGVNFFVDTDSIGKPRAQVACELLQELNSDCAGTWIKEDPIKIVENDPEFFGVFSVVICSRVPEKNLLKLSEYLWRRNIPLIIVDTIGYLGYLRLVFKEHTVTQSHPDNALEDLRLDQPFPELVNYFDKIEMSEMDNLNHSHTPYLVILYKALKTWQQQTGEHWPRNYKEKLQIKEIVRMGVMKNEDGVPLDEENFEEALRNVNNTFISTTIPSDIQTLVDCEMANHPLSSEANSRFWILVRALKEFVSQHGVLPLRGSLPDMFSDSKRYIELQTIYKTKSELDIAVIEEFVKEALDDLQLPASYICQEDIRSFCKNSAFLKILHGMSYHDEVKQELSERKITDALQQECGRDVYIVFRSFYKSLNEKDNVDTDKIVEVAYDLIKSLKLEAEAPKDMFLELSRVNYSELHCLASIMGGICAQEVIKLVTKQYVPLDNTFVVDQIRNETASFKL